MFKIEEKATNNINYAYYTFENSDQIITFSSVGASIVKWLVKDINGTFENIVVSYHNEADYIKNPKHLGANVGPYAGRIYPAFLPLNNSKLPLDKNFMNHANLHSGKSNLQSIHYDVEIKNDHTIVFKAIKKANESTFPGDLTIKIIYKISGNTLEQSFETFTNEDTYTNFTNHTYFNLSGDLKRDVLDHTLKIPAHLYGVLDEKFITSSLKGVTETIFDFRKPKAIKEGVIPLKSSPQLGLDHPFLLDRGAIVLHDPVSQRTLEIKTNQDSIVVYSNNFLIEEPLQNEVKDRSHLAVCLETQHYPNDIHFMKYPKSFHKANTVHVQKTTYRFFVGGNYDLL